MVQPEANPSNYAQEVLGRSKEALWRAVTVVSPENPQASPFEVFSAPGEVRADDAGLMLTAEQETELRSAAAELGFGRETDRTIGELGLSGASVVLEGGQPHKIVAEAQLALAESIAPRAIYFSAAVDRKITGAAEQASAARLGVSAETEYKVAQNIAEQLPGFWKPEGANAVVLPMSYDLALEGEATRPALTYALGAEHSGQFIRIGKVGEADVVMVRVDRSYYVDKEGNRKYKQPGPADLLSIIDAARRQQDDESTPIALVTSATYQPSREVDAVAASLKTDRVMGVATYGTARLAEVKGETVPAPGPINQLPGELHKLAKEVQKLEAALRPASEA